jgi:hypothetical protein
LKRSILQRKIIKGHWSCHVAAFLRDRGGFFIEYKEEKNEPGFSISFEYQSRQIQAGDFSLPPGRGGGLETTYAAG